MYKLFIVNYALSKKLTNNFVPWTKKRNFALA